MKQGNPDDLDKQIIYALQQDARHTSSGDVAAEMDFTPSTVRNRLKDLEEAEIITGYHVAIDYEKAGFQLYAKIAMNGGPELARKLEDERYDWVREEVYEQPDKAPTTTPHTP